MGSARNKLALVVNPIAGMGGSVGLKGTDGEDILKMAMELGAPQIAPRRAIEALKELSNHFSDFDLITARHGMGEDEARVCGFSPIVVGSVQKGRTTSLDTVNSVAEFLKLKTDFLLFAGGDGTARDVYSVVDNKLPVLGIPTGVKMHSGAFAVNPKAAGRLAALHMQGKVPTCEAEVMDIDEEAFRQNRLSAKLYGYLRVPCERQLIQGAKMAGGPMGREGLNEIAWSFIDDMDKESLYVIGPGTTAKSIMERLGLNYSLLGVDVVQGKKLVASDANEAELLKLVEDKKVKIIVTVIGGQGFILGRGNQQLSPRVIRIVGKDNIIVVATEDKLASLRGRPLLVDTGDEELDRILRGYMRVVTGYGRSVMYRVS